jgi:hypothetical protein
MFMLVASAYGRLVLLQLQGDKGACKWIERDAAQIQ